MSATAAVLSSVGAIPGQVWSDPVGYCRAVRTVDTPDARYRGPKDTPWMRRPFPGSATGPDGAPFAIAWRCMDGKVKVCAFGANAPCDAKAAVSRVPGPTLAAYCRDDPSARDIPMAATGHDTIYDWRCDHGRAVAGRVVLPIDRRGYQRAFWRTATP